MVQLFPYSLRLLQATSGRQRVLLLPSLSLLSIVRPLLAMGYSFGILTPFVRVAATISLADFWQVRHQNTHRLQTPPYHMDEISFQSDVGSPAVPFG